MPSCPLDPSPQTKSYLVKVMKAEWLPPAEASAMDKFAIN
jgi:hypothetical protein